jgi:hypothetical protein
MPRRGFEAVPRTRSRCLSANIRQRRNSNARHWPARRMSTPACDFRKSYLFASRAAAKACPDDMDSPGGPAPSPRVAGRGNPGRSAMCESRPVKPSHDDCRRPRTGRPARHRKGRPRRQARAPTTANPCSPPDERDGCPGQSYLGGGPYKFSAHCDNWRRTVAPEIVAFSPLLVIRMDLRPATNHSNILF